MTVYRPFTEKLGGTDPATFVGNYGELFYNADTQQVRISDGSTPGGLPIAGGGGSSLSNISDAGFGVNVNGKIQADGIDLGADGINASPGSTLIFEGTTISFGSATITGGNAFNSVINTHIWAGGTEPTNGYVLSWNSTLHSGDGDYEWVAQSSGGVQSSITDGTKSVSFNNSNEVVMDTDLNVDAINISGHILPSSNADFDLGNAEYKIRHLFLSDNSLRFGKNGTNDISGEYVSFGKDNLDRNAEVYTDQDGIVPPTPFSIGKKGDIRVFPDFMYVCIRTSEVDDGITVNWVRSSVESGW